MQILSVVPTYISTLLTPDSRPVLASLYTELALEGFEIAPLQYLHVTTLLSGVTSDTKETRMFLQPNMRFRAKITEPKQMGKWAALMLECPELDERQREWQRFGLVSLYPDFLPHLSVAKVEMDDALQTRLAAFEGRTIELYRESIVVGYKD